MPLSGKIFIPKTSILAYLIAFLISTFYVQQFPRYQRSQIYTRGLHTLDAPSGEIFVRQASTSQYLIAFLILAFYLQYFTIYQGDPKFTLGGAATPGSPLAEKYFHTQTKYYRISNCVFNFNFLALIFSEILEGPKFRLGGPMHT